MAPIYDSDVAESRWKQAEWRQFELWEKVEQRARKRVRWIIAGTCFLFLCFSSVPVIKSGMTKWKTLSEIRKISESWNHLKTRALKEGHAYRWTLLNTSESGEIVEEKVSDCSLAGKTLNIASRQTVKGFWIDEPFAVQSGFVGLTTKICFDPVKGFYADEQLVDVNSSVSLALVYSLIHDKEELTDRQNFHSLSLLNLKGDSAEISFE